MLMRSFVTLIIIIAIAVGTFAVVLHPENLIRVIVFRDFFDVSLPILAFGALIKYLCSDCFGCGRNKN